MKTTSTLAATTCSSVTLPAIRREKRLRRGSTATIAAAIFVRPFAEDDPVADGGQLALALGAVLQPAGEHRLDLAALDADSIEVVEPDDDAARAGSPPSPPTARGLEPESRPIPGLQAASLC